MHFFRLTDSIRQTYLHISYVNSEKSYSPLVLVFNANEIKIVEFIQESVFMHRKPCAAIESEFDVLIWKLYSLSSIPPPPRHTHTHTHAHTSISEPNKVQKFQFQTSAILLFTDVQKLYGPEFSQALPCILQYLDNLLRIFSNYLGEIDHFKLDLLKRSDT